MLFLKNNPVGIDLVIQGLQQQIHDDLCEIWGLNEDQYLCYGRAYRNQSHEAGGYVPEVHAGGNEYREVYHDDGKAAVSFFTSPENSTHDAITGREMADVALIFSVDLSKLPAYSNFAHRADEEVRRSVAMILEDPTGHFQLDEIVTGIANVYSGYDGIEDKTKVRFRDMHPFHCFRLNMTLTYQNQSCYTNLFA